MGTPSNPGWPTGYVPSQSEWAQAFSAKVDYPAPVAQGGTGALNPQGANYNILQRGLISTSGAISVVCARYGLQTSTGPLTLSLPPVASLGQGDWIDLYDVDFNANVNSVTITAAGSDMIALYGSSAASQVLSVAGVKVTLVINGSSWRMLV